MTLRQFQYRDPLEQLLRNESRTCKGCAFITKAWGQNTCSKQNQQYGRRCRHYTEREGTGNVSGQSEEGAGASGSSK